MGRPPLAAIATLLAVLGGCRDETIDKPPAPAMTDIIDAFASPSGTLDQPTATAVRAAVDAALEGLLGLGVHDEIFTATVDAIREAGEELDDDDDDDPAQVVTVGAPSKTPAKTQASSASSVAPRSWVGEGFGHVTRICDGWGPRPVPDEAANGHLRLTFTFTETSLDPVIWGDVERCLYRLDGTRLRLDPGSTPDDVRLYIGESKNVEELETTPVILALDVVATIDDQPPIAAQLAVRFVYVAVEVELLVPVSDGNVVVTLRGDLVVRVDAKNGTFECNPATRRCKNEVGDEVVL